MHPPSQHPGYIFLISVLVIGVIAAATSTSLLLLGWAAEQNGLLLVQSARSYEYAQTCIERSLRALRADVSYSGNETIAFTFGSCQINAITGSGNDDRNICVTGYSGDSVRRVEVHVDAVYPSGSIESWQEVSSFTGC